MQKNNEQKFEIRSECSTCSENPCYDAGCKILTDRESDSKHQLSYFCGKEDLAAAHRSYVLACIVFGIFAPISPMVRRE
jgi:hypothetical protein